MTRFRITFLVPSILCLFLVAGFWPKTIMAEPNIITRQTGGMVFSSDSKALIMVGADNGLPEQSTFSLTPRTVTDMVNGIPSAKLTTMQIPHSLASSSASLLYEIDAWNTGNSQHFISYPMPFTIVLPLDVSGDEAGNVENQNF